MGAKRSEKAGKTRNNRAAKRAQPPPEPEPPPDSFGRPRELVPVCGLGALELALLSGTTRRSNQDYLKGERTPNVKWAQAILSKRKDIDPMTFLSEIAQRGAA